MESNSEVERQIARRDRLWDEVWQLRYNVFYVEKSAEHMLNFWLTVDHVARPLTALFTSSSALAGWSLWSSPTGKITWVCLAGVAAVLSILTSTFGVQDRVKRLTETMGSFLRMRLRLDCLLSKMRLDPEFDLSAIEVDFHQFQEQYAESCPMWPHDVFFTKRRGLLVQDEINAATTPNYVEQPKSPSLPSSNQPSDES